MKKQIFLLVFILVSIGASAQTAIVFPGLTDAQKQKLLSTKIPMPLPTWIPEGFSVIKIVTKTGKQIKIENKILNVTYGKKLSNGNLLEFNIGAGFDGIGSMDYEGETVKSKVGNITLYYEPLEDVGDNKKAKQYGLIQTEWFDVKKLAFNVGFGNQSTNEKLNKTRPKISKADAKKILQSMQVLK